jgi:hypothetical protein
MSTVDRSLTALARELREVSDILAALGDRPDLPNIHMSLTIMPHDKDLPDADKIRAVDAIAGALLGEPGHTSADIHSRHSRRAGLYISVQATLAGPQKAREHELQAEVERLRAELTRRDAAPEGGEPSAQPA